MTLEWPLPASTAKLIGRLRLHAEAEKGRDVNLGLWLDKLLPREIPKDPKEQWSLAGESRRTIARAYEGLWNAPAARDAMARQEESCIGMHELGWKYERILARLETPAFLGPAGAADDALGMSFHAIWCAPRIAGSSLRGLAHAMLMESEIAEASFGRVARQSSEAGRLVFLDAAPVDGAFELALEVQTPHAAPYYSSRGRRPPAEWWSPKPFTFLVVRAATFAVDILATPARNKTEPSAAEVVRACADALEQVLERHGVGGKTTSGFGRCRVERKKVQ